MFRQDLKHQGNQGCLVRGGNRLGITCFRIHPFYRRNIQRARKKINNAVKERLNTLVFQGSPTEHRNQLQINSCFADTGHKHLGRHRRIRHIGLHNLIIKLCNGFNHSVPVSCGRIFHVFRNVRDLKRGTQGFVFPDQLFHIQQINHPLERLFMAHGDLHKKGVGPQTVTHHLDRSKQVSPWTIKLVHEGYFWHTVFVCLMPHGL